MERESLHCPFCFEEVDHDLIDILLEEEYDGIECPHCNEDFLIEKFVRFSDLPGIIRRGKARARMDYRPAEEFTKKQQSLFRVHDLSKKLERMRKGGSGKAKIKKVLAMRRQAAKEHRERAQRVAKMPAKISKWKELKGIAKEYKRLAKPEVAKRYKVARSAGQSRRSFLKSELKRILGKLKSKPQVKRPAPPKEKPAPIVAKKKKRKYDDFEVVGFSRGPRPKGKAKPFTRAGFTYNEGLLARIERILNS